MTPESALPSLEDCQGCDLYIKGLQGSKSSPERFLGRLVNLREQLTDEKVLVEIGYDMVMAVGHYSAIIDDLDDIIRCIERGMHEHPMDMETVAECDVCNPPPDSEDTEQRRHLRENAKDEDTEAR